MHFRLKLVLFFKMPTNNKLNFSLKFLIVNKAAFGLKVYKKTKTCKNIKNISSLKSTKKDLFLSIFQDLIFLSKTQ